MGCVKSRPRQPGPPNPGAEEAKQRAQDASGTVGRAAAVSDDVNAGASAGGSASATTSAATSSAATTSTAIVVQGFREATDDVDDVDDADGGSSDTGSGGGPSPRGQTPSPPRLIVPPPSSYSASASAMVEASAPSPVSGGDSSPAPQPSQPESLHGVLQKLSPASGRGWQTRLFVVAVAPDAILTSRSRAFVFYYID